MYDILVLLLSLSQAWGYYNICEDQLYMKIVLVMDLVSSSIRWSIQGFI